VLDEFGVYPAEVERELRRYLPFLATTKLLLAAVKAGMGREQAHALIGEHAIAAALEMRESGGEGGGDLLDRLAADSRLPLDRAALDDLMADRLAFAGAAPEQARRFAAAAETIVARHPEAATYSPGPIL
jgi:adenylosuccinate lyase